MKRVPKKKKKKKHGKVMIPVIIAAVLIVIAVMILLLLNKRNNPVNTQSYGISEEALKEASDNPDVMNVVFLGIDHQENRSDVMMVVSANKKTKQINVISLLRDTRVEIEGHAPTKLGYAYKWGGTDLALNTINTNFGTGFDRYICMTFEDLISIIDSIGGVDIQLSSSEADNVNDLAQETGYTNWDAVPGWNTLNGHQAVAYSRIRKIDSEYARAGRQQIVISAMIAKIKSMSVFGYPKLLGSVLGGLETNLSYGELLSIAMLGLGGAEINKYTIPDANYEEDLFGGWVLNPDGGPEEDPVQWLWVYDLNAASYRMKQIMYDPDYYEDPDLPFRAWAWNELADVIEGWNIDAEDINVEDEIIYIPPETAPQETHEEENEETYEETTTEQVTPAVTEETASQTEPSSEEAASEETTSEEAASEESSPEEAASEESPEPQSPEESSSDEHSGEEEQQDGEAVSEPEMPSGEDVTDTP